MKTIWKKIKIESEDMKLVLCYSMLIFLISLLASCSTMKKTVSKTSYEAKVTEEVKKDSVAVKAVDSISIRFLSKLDSMNEDSVYHTVTRIEERIKVVNDTTKEIQRTTFIDAKGKTVRHMVKRASSTQATQVNKTDSVKTELKKSNAATVTAKTFDKHVKRTGLSIWTYVFGFVFIVAVCLVCYFFPGFFPGIFFAIFKRRKKSVTNERTNTLYTAWRKPEA